MHFRYPDKPILAQPSFLQTAVDEEWAVESKLDGFRCLVEKVNGVLKFKSRNNIIFKVKKEIIDFFKNLPNNSIIDSEWINHSRIKAINSEFKQQLPLYESLGVFDILQYNGEWLGSQTLAERLRHPFLKKIMTLGIGDIPNVDVFRIPNLNGAEAVTFFEQQKKYLISEGVVVKKLSSRVTGSRTKSVLNNGWYKIKYRNAK